MKLPQL
jgi:hypothetical protein